MKRRDQSTAAATAPYVALFITIKCCRRLLSVQLADWIRVFLARRETRPVPSPAFDQETRRNVVHPLQNVQRQEMDES